MNVHSHEFDLLLLALNLALHCLPHRIPHPAAELQLLGALLSVLRLGKVCNISFHNSRSTF